MLNLVYIRKIMCQNTIKSVSNNTLECQGENLSALYAFRIHVWRKVFVDTLFLAWELLGILV
ncbi:hypothetical protein CBE01nite_11610 [Clostridium beijerinckii]|nr:hypothetical protein CBE01nite_11610 [Clostridium beijerinckii]